MVLMVAVAYGGNLMAVTYGNQHGELIIDIQGYLQ